MKEPYVPDVGHLVWVSLDPQKGREQAGRGPFLVLSPRAYNRKTSLAVGVLVTSKRKGYPFEVPLPAGGLVNGVALAYQVKSLDWHARGAEFSSRVAQRTVRDVRALIAALVGFP